MTSIYSRLDLDPSFLSQTLQRDAETCMLLCCPATHTSCCEQKPLFLTHAAVWLLLAYTAALLLVGRGGGLYVLAVTLLRSCLI